jgi:hypothetical protein
MKNIYDELCFYIPLDLWRIIFCYTPITILCKFEVVCREWKNMIQSSDFCKKWSKNNLENKMVVFCYNSLQIVSMLDFSSGQRYQIKCSFF